jgi:glycosyltransferase involved in cell wall biosynthesis
MVDISVLTPSLAYGRFIEDNILSVLGQADVSVQHVVQDAGSTDDTVDVLRRHGGATDWRSEPDAGQSDALNNALQRAKGRWIAWLNADEFYLPSGLAELMRKGDTTSADVVYGDSVFVDEQGRLGRLAAQHRFRPRTLRLYGCYIASSSVLFRRSALLPDPWDVTLKLRMDWDLYLRLASGGARFEKIAYPVGAFRRHESQVSAEPSERHMGEWYRVAASQGIKPGRGSLGLLMHRGFQLTSGAYVKQLRALGLRGRDLRWFRTPAGGETFRELLRVCYGRELPRGARVTG